MAGASSAAGAERSHQDILDMVEGLEGEAEAGGAEAGSHGLEFSDVRSWDPYGLIYILYSIM